MKKNNWLYVLYQSFTSDLLFWIVIDNLYLTTVKGFEAFQVVLITMLGIVFSLILYPLTNIVVKKTNNKTSIILGSVCYIIAIILFVFCKSIYGFIIAQTFYNMSNPFRAVSSIMLKNNLKKLDCQDQFVKWQSYGKLGYSIITLIISLFAGVLFNVYAYLPLILAFVGAVVGLIFAILYKDVSTEQTQTVENVKIIPVMLNKTMILIFLMNVITVGTFVFLQTRATLLIQYICQEATIDLKNISLIVSAIVFGSRIIRVVSNAVFPKIYKKINSKPKIIIFISICILLSNIFFAIGGNISSHYVIKLVFITIGFYIILAVRDCYSVSESKIIASNIDEDKQKQAFVLAGIYEKMGRLFSNGFALIFLGFLPINMVYVCMLALGISQIFISVILAKKFN